MKKLIYISTATLLLGSCASYTEDQGKAADEFCTCMEAEGDFDIKFYECEIALHGTYDMATFADEGWGLALEEKCPSVAGEISESE